MDGRIQGQVAALGFCEGSGKIQAQTPALLQALIPLLDAFKSVEDDFLVLGGNAGTVVGYRYFKTMIIDVSGNINRRIGRAIFLGIGQQIADDLFKVYFVRPKRRQLGLDMPEDGMFAIGQHGGGSPFQQRSYCYWPQV